MNAEEYVVRRVIELEEENRQLTTALEIRSTEVRHLECDLITVLHLIHSELSPSKIKMFTLGLYETYDKEKFECLAEIFEKYGIARPEHDEVTYTNETSSEVE